MSGRSTFGEGSSWVMITRRSGESQGGSCAPLRLEYDTRTPHTNMDTYERLIPEDLRQAAIVVATMLYNTALRDQLLPRRTLPP